MAVRRRNSSLPASEAALIATVGTMLVEEVPFPQKAGMRERSPTETRKPFVELVAKFRIAATVFVGFRVWLPSSEEAPFVACPS